MPDRLCPSAGLNQIIPLDNNNIILTKVSDTHWNTPVMSNFNCNYVHIFTNKYYNIHVQTYDAQLIGAANIIKQHLTKTPCSAAIDTTLHMGSWFPQEYPNHITLCTDRHQKRELGTLGTFWEFTTKSKDKDPISLYHLCIQVRSFKKNSDQQEKSFNRITASSSDMLQLLETFYKACLTSSSSMLKQFQAMRLHPWLKPTSFRHCSFKNKFRVKSGNACISAKWG